MHTYTTQLIHDLESAILARWHERPPHYFEIGATWAAPWLTPPEGYTGPEAGFGQDDPDAYPPLPDFMLDEETEETEDFTSEETAPELESESGLNLEFEKTIAEMEQWRDEKPPERQDMFYHFGFEPEQFPPAELLSDTDLDAISERLCRLWAAYNFTAVVPDNAPGRVLYPLLLGRMKQPTFVMTRGTMGIEFCSYEPKECPFGPEYCTCKDDE